MDLSRKLYYAASSNNIAQLEGILEEENAENDLENSLSKVCMELQLNRVHVSEEVNLILERKLLGFRLLYEQHKSNISSQNIKERLYFLIELIQNLNDQKDNDEIFIATLNFIAKQVFTLKGLLKSTYDRVPWEEIEFCVLSYIKTSKEQSEIVIFTRVILSKTKIISYLESFRKCLISLCSYVDVSRPQELSRFPVLKREEVVEEIIARYPEFQSMYNNHERIRDIHSLDIMLSYVKLIESVNLEEKNSVLIVIRVLQIIGEHMKNTLESPKLSQTTISYLLTFFSENTRMVVIKLRNTFSHIQSLSRREELLDNLDSHFLTGIKSDLEKIGAQISYILSKYKIQTLMELGEKFLNTNDDSVMKEIAGVMKNLGTREFFGNSHPEFKNDDLVRLKNLINEYRTKIKAGSGYIQILFEMIDAILDRHPMGKPINYSSALLAFGGLYEKFQMMIDNSRNKSNYIRTIKCGIRETLKDLSPKIEASKFNTLAEMIFIIHSLVPEDEELEKLFFKIFQILKFDANNVQWTERFGRKLRRMDFDTDTFYSGKFDGATKNRSQEKLSQLRQIFSGVSYSQFQKDKKLQAITEVLLIDLIPMLCGNMKSRFFLDDFHPTLYGVQLRNHLAHNNVIIEVLLNSNLAVFLFAEKLLSEEGKLNSLILREVPLSDATQLKNSYNFCLDILDKKLKMFDALEGNNFDAFLECIEKGSDVRSRDINLSTCLHFAMKKPDTIKLTKLLWKEGLSAKLKNLDSQTPLHIAATKTNLEVVEFLINNFESTLDECDAFKRTPAHLAAFHGNEHILNTLLNHGADMTKKDYMYFSPLQYAVMSGKPSSVEFFFKKNLFHKLDEGFGGFTTLHIVADHGSVKMMDYLLSKKPRVDAKSDAGATPLHLAALNGYHEEVCSLIRAGADVNTSNMNGNYALHWACETGREEIAKVLVQNGAEINVTDYTTNFAPIHYLAKEGYIKILEFFLENGANVNVATTEGYTPLLYAVEGSQLDVVKMLTAHNADVNARNVIGMTALHVASSKGDLEIVKLLLEKGAGVNCQNAEGFTPLHLAAGGDHEDVFDLLLSHDASIHAKTLVDKLLPLHSAARSGNVDIIRKLLHKGCSINASTANNENCLHIAVRYGNNIIDYLVQEGIDLEVKTKNHGLTPLHEAVVANSIDMVTNLLQAGSYINAQDSSGNTPLHLAVERDSVEISNLLLDKGADAAKENDTGETAFTLAVKHNRMKFVKAHLLSRSFQKKFMLKAIRNTVLDGNTSMFKLFLEHAPYLDLNLADYCDPEGNSLLHLASSFGKVDIVELVLNYGGYAVNSGNNDGQSPLFLAVAKGCDETVEILLKNGAEINTQDNAGLTPLHVVADHNHEKLVRLLLDFGADEGITDKEGRLPVEQAVAEGHLNSVKLFLNKDRCLLNRLGSQDWSLLHIASHFGHAHIVRFLLEEGADMNSTNTFGLKPIHIAATEGFTEIIDIFVEKGMEYDVRGKNNETLMHYAASTGKLNVVKYLLERGCDINSLTDANTSPLHEAVYKGHKNVVEYLLNNGAVLVGTGALNSDDVVNNVKKLFAAIKDGEKTDVEKLVKKGVPLNCSDVNKGSPLHFATYKGETDIVEILLRYKASTNLKYKNGWTPLHYACKYGHDKIVFLLLKHGAKYNVEDDNGKKPVDFAGNRNISNLLQLVDDCFENVQKKKINIVANRLKKIKDADVVKAVMRTENSKGLDLITFAIKNKVTKLETLEEVYQENVQSQMKNVDRLISQEKFREAEWVLLDVYEKRRDLFGDHNPATLSIKSKIAGVLYKQHLFEKSLQCSKEICEHLEKCFGADHKLALREKSSIALILHRLGKNEESLRIFEEIHAIQKKTLPPDNQDYLSTAKHMAITMMALGKLDEAHEIYSEALKIEEKKYGLLHPHTLVAKNNIALILSKTGKPDEALKIFQEVYEGRKLVLGKYHSDTLRAIHNKICVYRDQERYDEALEAFKKLLREQREHLGLYNLDTLNTQAAMADILLKQCKFFAAFKILKEIKDHKLALQGPEHLEIQIINKEMEAIVEQYRKIGINGDLDSFVDTLVDTMNKAARFGEVDTMEKLIRSGVDVSERDSDGRNCLHYAADGNNVEVIKLFLKHGGNITDRTNKGNTALHTACNKGYKEVVGFLLEAVGTKQLSYLLNAVTKVGQKTALHVAAQQGHVDIVRLLLKKGAVYNCADKNGKKPIDLTNDECVKRILNVTQQTFTNCVKKDFSKVSALYEINIDDFLCVTHAKNCENDTVLKLLISNGQTEVARSLTTRIVKSKTTARNL